MIAQDKAFVITAPSARAAQLHPAAGKGIAEVAEAFDPWTLGGARGAQHQGAFKVSSVAHLADQLCRGQRHPCITVRGVECLYGAVHHDRRNRRIDATQNALCLAKAVTHEYASAPHSRIGCPPGIDLSEHLCIRSPAVDRQAKSGLRDKHIAAYRLERCAGRVWCDLVVTAGDPGLPAMGQTDLRRTQHVAGWMQRHGHTVVRDLLAIRHTLQGNVGTQPSAQHAFSRCRCQIVAVPRACVVGMRMGDHSATNRPPRINIKVALRTIKALRSLNDQILHGHEVNSRYSITLTSDPDTQPHQGIGKVPQQTLT